MQELFEPLRLGKLTLPNRLVMAPMTRSRCTGGSPTELTAEYYAQRAGAGLIVTEATQPSAIGQGYIDTPGLHSAEQIAGWRQVTDAVHDRDGRIFVQLMHAGRVGHPCLYPDGALPVAPSSIACDDRLYTADGLLDRPVPREMTLDDIAWTIDDFVFAARCAMDAGFDGVELHGANGYLIHQFLADNTNLRTDGYGGSIPNRIRFAEEVARAVADAIGPERVGIRLSPGSTSNGVSESDPGRLYQALIRALAPLGLAYVHVMEFGHREVTELIRREWAGPLILNPHRTGDEAMVRPEVAHEAVRSGLADAVGIAALWLANPDLPARILAGGPYNEPDPATFYGGDHRGYTDYPTLQR
ncbi:NADH:flavin oxidoreductase/NADH oxidase [Kribbella flavida DSM 17836]|uniref:NADH:flavin oxidoreductase/NADH oxidase n=1 Tax=Kribbella flavida (strain DSM 17836 / JCM 10339 / NBRC 14399) TaxID=479435 RepID=D2PZR3_KRIFD|nr:alkene reductase [Kribbella flavida]ADB35629.1 NADH:flavin oxidoreductase/NADH oxidase [Kribbella flavida DSM 17836]